MSLNMQSPCIVGSTEALEAGQGASLDSQGCEIKDAPEAVPPVGSSLGPLLPPRTH